MGIQRLWRGVGHASNVQFAVQAIKWGVPLVFGAVTGAAALANKQPLWVVLILAAAAFCLVALTVRAMLPVADRIGRWRESRKSSPIRLQEELYYCSGHLVGPDGKSSEMIETAFCLVAYNDRPDGLTLRNVQALLAWIHGPPILLPAVAMDGTRQSRTDIRHGEAVRFEVGRTLSPEFIGGILRPPPTVSDVEDWNYLKHNWEHGHQSLRISAIDPHSKTVFAHIKGNATIPDSEGFPFKIIVTADDVRSASVRYRLRLGFIPDEPARVFQKEEESE